MKVMAGSWLIASVCIERMMAMIVDHLRRVRQQLGNPGAVLPVLGELEDGGRDREARLSRRHRGETLALANRVGQILVEPVVHRRLVVEGLHLRRRADHMQIDRAFGFRREVRQGGQSFADVEMRGGSGSCFRAQQIGERGDAESARAASKELAARFCLQAFAQRVGPGPRGMFSFV